MLLRAVDEVVPALDGLGVVGTADPDEDTAALPVAEGVPAPAPPEAGEVAIGAAAAAATGAAADEDKTVDDAEERAAPTDFDLRMDADSECTTGGVGGLAAAAKTGSAVVAVDGVAGTGAADAVVVVLLVLAAAVLAAAPPSEARPPSRRLSCRADAATTDDADEAAAAVAEAEALENDDDDEVVAVAVGVGVEAAETAADVAPRPDAAVGLLCRDSDAGRRWPPRPPSRAAAAAVAEAALDDDADEDAFIFANHSLEAFARAEDTYTSRRAIRLSGSGNSSTSFGNSVCQTRATFAVNSTASSSMQQYTSDNHNND